MVDLRRLLFLGTYIAQDDGDNAAFSPAANYFQKNLLQGLLKIGLNDIIAITVTPIPSFPRSSIIFWMSTFYYNHGGIKISQVSFLNFSVLKPVTQAIGVLSKALVLLTMRNFRPQVLVTYNAPQRWAIPALFVARLFRVPAVCVAADVQPLDGGSWAFRILHRMRAFWLQRFDGVIVLSKMIVTDFLRPDQQWLSIDGGVMPEDFNYKNEEADPNILYYAGTLSVGSGIELLLKAFELLPVNYKLRITGNGPLKDLVQQASIINPRIQYFGLITRYDQLQLLQNSGILINPRLVSEPENRYNFPSKIIEYIATGRPVISTMTGDLKDEYADKVFVCPEETPKALACTILDVASMDPQLRRRKCKHAREFILREKNWQKQSESIYNFLTKLRSAADAN